MIQIQSKIINKFPFYHWPTNSLIPNPAKQKYVIMYTFHVDTTRYDFTYARGKKDDFLVELDINQKFQSMSNANKIPWIRFSDYDVLPFFKDLVDTYHVPAKAILDDIYAMLQHVEVGFFDDEFMDQAIPQLVSKYQAYKLTKVQLVQMRVYYHFLFMTFTSELYYLNSKMKWGKLGPGLKLLMFYHGLVQGMDTMNAANFSDDVSESYLRREILKVTNKYNFDPEVVLIAHPN